MLSRTSFACLKSLVSALSVLVTLCCAGFCCAGVANGQDKRDSEQISGLEDLPVGPSLIFKDPATGVMTRIPGFDQKALKRALESIQKPEIAEFEFTEVSIQGQVTSDQFVKLQVSVRVFVNVDLQRVNVPVGFGEFNLLNQEHSCEMPACWGRYSTNALPQKSWVLFGAGEHRLTFEVIGKLKSSNNGQTRFRLQCPVAPISNLALQVGEVVEAATLANKNLLVIDNDGPNQTSILRTWELASLTEISWTRKPTEIQQQSVSVQVTSTDMQLDLRTDPGSLVIDQNLMISGGAINRLDVRLPEGFSNVSLDVLNPDGNAIIPSIREQSEWLEVRFAESVTGPITLTWDMELTQRSYPQKIGLMLPKIRDVPDQSGRLEVFVPFGLDVKPPIEKNTRRIRVTTESDSRTAAFAYRLLSTESRVDLSISETEAFYTVAPHINLNASRAEGLLELQARFRVNVVRGSRSDLSVMWPSYLVNGWRIEEPRLLTGEQSVPVYGDARDENSDEYVLQFPERQSGEFIVELRAYRALESVLNDEGLIYLPDISSPTPHTSIVSLIESDTETILLKPANAEASFPILPSSRWPVSLKQEQRGFTAWLIDNPSRQLQLELKDQEPEVDIDVIAELRMDNGSVVVHQTLAFDVRYEDLTQIRLQLPGRRPVVRLAGSKEVLVRQTSTDRLATYNLPTARRGSFEITVDYLWTPSSPVDDNAIAQVPLARPENSVRSVLAVTNHVDSISVADKSWTRVYHPDFPVAWETESSSSVVPVRLNFRRRSRDSFRPRFVVMNSAVVGSQLLTSLSAIYDPDVNSALFRLDSSAEMLNASIDGIEVAWEQISRVDEVRKLVQLQNSTGGDGEQPRIFRLVVRQPLDAQHHLFAVVRPELPTPAGGAMESCNGIWLLAQTSEQSLFSYSQQIRSIGGRLWSRLVGRRAEEVDANIRTVLSPYDDLVRSSVQRVINQHLAGIEKTDVMVGAVFSDSPMLVIVSSRLIYLVIALLSLGTYVAILRLSIARLMLLTGVFAVLVAGVVSVTPVAVHVSLLQVVPGCILALGIAVIQKWMSRHTVNSFHGSSEIDANTVFAQSATSASQSSTMTL